MNTVLHQDISSYRNELCARMKRETTRLEQLKGCRSKRLKVMRKAGNDYYSVIDGSSGKSKYLGTADNEEVRNIKEAHYLDTSLKELRHEIGLLDEILCKSRDLSYDSINDRLHRAYKGATTQQAVSASEEAQIWKAKAEHTISLYPPFRPEERIHSTRDGTKVRSKSEALIYNELLDLGVTFAYELPLRIRAGNKESLLLPDFSIFSEISPGRIIYIEHQGMMSTPKYREKFNDSVFKYWSNGYLPEMDVFFTFDSVNGAFVYSPVKDIIYRHVRRV